LLTFFGRRGFAAAVALSVVLVGGSSEALGQQAVTPVAAPAAQPAVAAISSAPVQFNLPSPFPAAKPSPQPLVQKFPRPAP